MADRLKEIAAQLYEVLDCRGGMAMASIEMALRGACTVGMVKAAQIADDYEGHLLRSRDQNDVIANEIAARIRKAASEEESNGG